MKLAAGMNSSFMPVVKVLTNAVVAIVVLLIVTDCVVANTPVGIDTTFVDVLKVANVNQLVPSYSFNAHAVAVVVSIQIIPATA